MGRLITTIEELLVEKFKEEDFNDLFLVEIKQPIDNRLEIYVDSDTMLTIGQCARLSRYLEHHLEEQELVPEKYTLEVSSPGVGKPLLLHRQYLKNKGRTVSVEVVNEHKHVHGILEEVSESGIVVTWEEKQRLEGKKKKVLVQMKKELTFDEIKNTVVKAVF